MNNRQWLKSGQRKLNELAMLMYMSINQDSCQIKLFFKNQR